MTNDLPHISQLQEKLYSQFLGLCDETIDPKRAVEVNNTAGKLMSTYKSQLTYHALRGEAPTIPFLAAEVAGPAQRPALVSPDAAAGAGLLTA